MADTYVDLQAFGKGIVLVNGHHLGRFWQKGATQTLYLPKGFLKEGQNEIVIFETEGQYASTLNLVSSPIFDLKENTLH